MYEKLRSLRHEKELTGEYMAIKLGIQKAAYSKKENGLLRFSLREAKIISGIFGMSIDDIFFDDEVSEMETN